VTDRIELYALRDTASEEEGWKAIFLGTGLSCIVLLVCFTTLPGMIPGYPMVSGYFASLILVGLMFGGYPFCSWASDRWAWIAKRKKALEAGWIFGFFVGGGLLVIGCIISCVL